MDHLEWIDELNGRREYTRLIGGAGAGLSSRSGDTPCRRDGGAT